MLTAMNDRRLGVNIDHIATLRQLRRERYPDPVHAAALAEMAGAQQIVVHLREDRGHMQERDVRLLRQTVQTRLNVQLSMSVESLKFALDIEPDLVTFVPDRRDERGDQQPLDVVYYRDLLKKNVQILRDGAIVACLSIEPDLDQVRGAHRVDAYGVELEATKYCCAKDETERRIELQRLADAARAANKLGLRVAVGHGLNYQNVSALVGITEIEWFNVGHAIIARAMLSGLDAAVRDMRAVLAYREIR
jgi:pyridoxine 5-phosphate synthase